AGRATRASRATGAGRTARAGRATRTSRAARADGPAGDQGACNARGATGCGRAATAVVGASGNRRPDAGKADDGNYEMRKFGSHRKTSSLILKGKREDPKRAIREDAIGLHARTMRAGCSMRE